MVVYDAIVDSKIDDKGRYLIELSSGRKIIACNFSDTYIKKGTHVQFSSNTLSLFLVP